MILDYVISLIGLASHNRNGARALRSRILRSVLHLCLSSSSATSPAVITIE